MDGGPNALSAASSWEIQMKLLAFGFGLAQFWINLRSDSVNEKDVSLSLSLSPNKINI